MFTREELEQLTIKQLRKLAAYCDVELPSKIKKGEIIDKIYEEIVGDVVKEDEGTPQRSVRIRRMYKENLE